jgi:hypothetical protein
MRSMVEGAGLLLCKPILAPTGALLRATSSASGGGKKIIALKLKSEAAARGAGYSSIRLSAALPMPRTFPVRGFTW